MQDMPVSLAGSAGIARDSMTSEELARITSTLEAPSPDKSRSDSPVNISPASSSPSLAGRATPPSFEPSSPQNSNNNNNGGMKSAASQRALRERQSAVERARTQNIQMRDSERAVHELELKDAEKSSSGSNSQSGSRASCAQIKHGLSVTAMARSSSTESTQDVSEAVLNAQQQGGGDANSAKPKPDDNAQKSPGSDGKSPSPSASPNPEGSANGNGNSAHSASSGGISAHILPSTSASCSRACMHVQCVDKNGAEIPLDAMVLGCPPLDMHSDDEVSVCVTWISSCVHSYLNAYVKGKCA